MNVAGGEAYTVSVRGVFGGAFIIAGSASATQCVSFPGINNSLALSFPTRAYAQARVSYARGVADVPCL